MKSLTLNESNLENVKRDANTPYSFLEWKKNTIKSDVRELSYDYNNYLVNWFETNRDQAVSRKFLLRQKYLTLLERLDIYFTNEEKNNWYTKVNLADESELLLSIPYFAKKLKNISLYYQNLRNKLQTVTQKYSEAGTNYGLERAIREYLLEVFSHQKQDLSTDNNVTFPLIPNLDENLSIEILESYDDKNYFDVSPDVDPNNYVNLKETSINSFLEKNYNISLSSNQWMFNPLQVDPQLNFETFFENLTSAVSETTDSNTYKTYIESFINQTKKSVVEIVNEEITTNVYDIPIKQGNNFFYFPYGGTEVSTLNQKQDFIVPLSSLSFVSNDNFSPTAGSTLAESDVMFVKTKNETKAAWLRFQEYENSTQTLKASIKRDNKTSFVFPFPGYGLSAENSPWTGFDFKTTEQFDFLKRDLKQAVMNAYWNSPLPVDTCKSIYLNDISSFKANSTPNTYSTYSDQIQILDKRIDDTNVPLTNTKELWFYKFLKTSLPVTLESPNVFLWPYTRINEDVATIPQEFINKDYSTVCNPTPINSINNSFFVADSNFEFADKIYKVPSPNSSTDKATEMAWLYSNFRVNNKNGYYVQDGFSAFFEAGVSTTFVWAGPTILANTVFKNVKHRKDCLLYSNPKNLKWEECDCKQIYYAPYGGNNQKKNWDTITRVSTGEINYYLGVGWGNGTWSNNNFYLIEGEKYIYHRKADVQLQETFPDYIVNFDFQKKETIWLKGVQDPTSMEWKADPTNTISDLTFYAGDLLYIEKQTSSRFFEVTSIQIENLISSSASTETSNIGSSISEEYNILSTVLEEESISSDVNFAANVNATVSKASTMGATVETGINVRTSKGISTNTSKGIGAINAVVNSQLNTNTNVIPNNNNSSNPVGGNKGYIQSSSPVIINGVPVTASGTGAGSTTGGSNIPNLNNTNNNPSTATTGINGIPLGELGPVNLWATYDTIPVVCGQQNGTVISWPDNNNPYDSKNPQNPPIKRSEVSRFIGWTIIRDEDGSEQTILDDTSFVNFVPPITGTYTIRVSAASDEVDDVGTGTNNYQTFVLDNKQEVDFSNTNFKIEVIEMQVPTPPLSTIAAISGTNGFPNTGVINGTQSTETKEVIVLYPTPNTYYNTNQSTQVSGVSSRAPQERIFVVTYPTIPKIKAIDPYTTKYVLEQTERRVAGFVLEEKLHGWNYAKRKWDGKSVGAQPFWAILDIEKNSTTRQKSVYSWGYPDSYLEEYIPNNSPIYSPLTLNYGNVISYVRKGETFNLTIPFEYNKLVNQIQWCQLSADLSTVSNLGTFFDSKFRIEPISIPQYTVTDIVLSNLIDGAPVEVYYYAMKDFVWSFDTKITTKATLTAENVYLSQSPWQNLSNRFFPTVASVPLLEQTYTSEDVGGYFTPKHLGVSMFINKNFTAGINSEIDLTSKDIIIANSKGYIGGRGRTQQDQPEVYNWEENNQWMKENVTSAELAGAVKQKLTKTLQTFVPYESNDKTTALGIVTQQSLISPWGGVNDEEWIDTDLEPKSFTGVRNVSAWADAQVTKQTEETIDQWTSDIFGNQYGVYKKVGNTSNTVRQNTGGELWVKTNSQKVMPARVALSSVFMSFDWEPTIKNQLNNDGILDFECYFDVLFLKTENINLFAKIGFDFETNTITGVYDNIRRKTLDNNYRHDANWFFAEDKKIISLYTKSISGTFVPELWELDLIQLQQNKIFPTTQTEQERLILDFKAVDLVSTTKGMINYNKTRNNILITYSTLNSKKEFSVLDILLKYTSPIKVEKIDLYTTAKEEIKPPYIDKQQTIYHTITANTPFDIKIKAQNDPKNIEILNYASVIGTINAIGEITFTGTLPVGLHHVNYTISNLADSTTNCITLQAI